MAYGGGTFITHNKTLPGAYVNYVSGGRSPFLMSERGVVALPLFIDWGPENEVYEVSKQEILNDSLAIFGYPYNAPEMLPLRELVKADVRTVKVYRLTCDGEDERAECIIDSTVKVAKAKYVGARGSALALRIEASVDGGDGSFDVTTLLDGRIVDEQKGVENYVAATTEDEAKPNTLRDNAWVTFINTAMLSETVDLFEGGVAEFTDVTSKPILNSVHDDALKAFESEYFHSLICPSGKGEAVATYVDWTRTQRDIVGRKFLLAAYKANDPDHKDNNNEPDPILADYMGVTSVNSKVNLPDDYIEANSPWLGEWSAVYWVGGRLGAVPLTRSLEGNANAYNGELNIAANLKPRELERAINEGLFVFHKNDDGQRVVLKDINSKKYTSDDEGVEYQLNQVVRVCDQIAMDVANLFTRRKLGNTPNDAQGRAILRADIIDYLRDMERLRIVQQFDPDTVEALPGRYKDDVIVNLNGINITAFMLKLYMTIYTI